MYDLLLRSEYGDFKGSWTVDGKFTVEVAPKKICLTWPLLRTMEVSVDGVVELHGVGYQLLCWDAQAGGMCVQRLGPARPEPRS